MQDFLLLVGVFDCEGGLDFELASEKTQKQRAAGSVDFQGPLYLFRKRVQGPKGDFECAGVDGTFDLIEMMSEFD